MKVQKSPQAVLALRALCIRKSLGRKAAFTFASKNGVFPLYRLACQLDAAKTLS